MNKTLQKEQYNLNKLERKKAEERRDSERIQELIQQTRSNLGLGEVNKHEKTKS